MGLSRLFKRERQGESARALYQAVVGQSRRPEFYARCGVPDTLDGRFDLIALHAFLLLHRLKRDHPATADLAQDLFDTLFLDMDHNLREMGVGDLAVGKRIKSMVQGLYGRIAAYEAGLALAGDADLTAALRRNLYGTVAPRADQLAAMAGYLRREAADLTGQPIASLMAGTVAFGAPPEPAAGDAGAA